MKHLEARLVSPKQRRVPFGALLVVCALLATVQLVPQLRSLTDASTVCIAGVTYVGHHDLARQQTKYLGVPYAIPPVHALRFRPPAPYAADPDTIGTVQQAVAFGPSCPQSTPVPYPVSEDCLTANVWVPHVPRELRLSLAQELENGLPVLVWIYDLFFFDEPAQIARNHRFANIPLIIGGTLDEGTDFVPSLDSNTSLLAYFSQTRPGLTFGIESPSAKHALQQFIERYPDDPAQGSPFGTGKELFGRGKQTKRGAAIFGDWLFEASGRRQHESYN
ncbi:hypothetical protein FRC06_000110 [Ceratobasidium sp. 370]|nr:hypothetical protein FRC06_000110 [Ceratobasidium sp. 370]